MVKNRPRVLDLFSGIGGAAKGYDDAGLLVARGVDIVHRARYPYSFALDDALLYAEAHGDEYDVIHASPPCQFSSTLTKGTNKGREYLNLIPETRKILDRIGKPYVIENVQGSEVRRDLTLCGEMFGLAVIRHRYFELGNWTAEAPQHIKHRGRVAGMRHGEWFTGPYFAVYGDGGGKGSVADWQRAMGIDWTGVRKEIAEAIPPAYTQYIGEQFLTWRRGRQ
jgi:hypothetical protein